MTTAEAPGTTSSRFARLIVRLRYVIPVLWIAGAVLATLLLPTIEQAQTGGLGDLVPKDAEAIKTEERAAEQFGFPLLSRTVVVQRDTDGISRLAEARVVQRAVAITRGQVGNLSRVAAALPVVNVEGVTPFAREQSTTALTYLFFRPEVSRQDREIYAERLKESIQFREGREQYVGVTGALPARTDQADAVKDALPFIELMTVLLVGLVVGLHFRAPLAPLVTLVGIGVAYLIALRAMAGIGQKVGISVPSEVEPIVVVLLFGIVTDYAIFFLSRFRQRLSEGQPPLRAAESATAELQGIVLTAALIVAAGSASLVVAELGFFQAFGPGMALAVVVGGAVSLTFIPACLALFGTAIFWPSRPGREISAEQASEEPSAHHRVGRTGAVGLAARRPVLVATVTTVALLVLASGLARIDLGQTLIRGLPAGTEARTAYNAAAAGFTPGILSPTMIVVEKPEIEKSRRALIELQGRLQARGGVAQVVGPREQPADRTFGAIFAQGGGAVRYLVIFRDDPLGARAINAVTRLRRDLPALLRQSGLTNAEASIAGDTALAEETVVDARGDIGRVAPTVLLVVFVLLAIFLRALVAPFYLVIASVLALSAALGTTVYVFRLFGQDELTYFVPFAAAVLLVPLGSDYNVFLAGRIWSEARVRPIREAVMVGGSRAATAITIAGIVLALSFGLLAVVPLRAFRELAFAMFAGLLIDAFVVRTLLVPALIALVGEKSAWPSRLRQMPAGPDAHPSTSPVLVERKL
ncbi:MAG: MMPL family transporter [Solirubrobacterales bacterium]|nr:MMPL family transporter [Solirubrobacterales bacterium]